MNLKSFISAFDLLTVVIGNLLVVIISALPIENQVIQFYYISINLMLSSFFIIILGLRILDILWTHGCRYDAIRLFQCCVSKL